MCKTNLDSIQYWVCLPYKSVIMKHIAYTCIINACIAWVFKNLKKKSKILWGNGIHVHCYIMKICANKGPKEDKRNKNQLRDAANQKKNKKIGKKNK